MLRLNLNNHFLYLDIYTSLEGVELGPLAKPKLEVILIKTPQFDALYAEELKVMEANRAQNEAMY